MELRDLRNVRGEILEKFISIEKTIDLIINFHYFKQLNLSFYYHVLGDEYFSFALKRRILERITGIEFQELRRLNNIRNWFSHGGGILIEPGDKNTPPYLPDTCDWNKPIDYEQLKMEFLKKEPIVRKVLDEELKKRGWKVPE
jgi:hypothetical protein